MIIDILNFVFLLASFVLLSGEISELKGKVDSMLISMREMRDKNDKKK